MLIGLNGFAGAGKDTVGEYLVENYGFTLDKFANPLYDSAAAALGIDRKWLEKFKDDPMASITFDSPLGHRSLTVRQFLQFYGTEAHRDVFGDDFWVDECLSVYTDITQKLVITDARFDNELQAIRDLSGFTFRIERDTGKSDSHISEKLPNPKLITAIIDNNGTLEQLYEKVNQIVWEYCRLLPKED